MDFFQILFFRRFCAAALGPAVVAQRHVWESVGERLESIYGSVLDARKN